MSISPSESWLSHSGPDSDVVLSCRARLARNIDGYPFLTQADRAQRTEILNYARQAIVACKLDEAMRWIELSHCPLSDRRFLVERHLISTQLAEGDEPRGVAVSGDETLSIMVNEEDHLRMQALLPGAQVDQAYARVDQVDDALESLVDYAFSERFGFLTACPTNVGTGLRLGVMAHLPALKITNEIDKVRRAAKDLQLAVRGFFGEGTEAIGGFYQISNQVTLGVTEASLLEEFREMIVPRLIDYERTAREHVAKQHTLRLEDRTYRSLAILQNARLLESNEAMKLLSRVRLGVAVGLISDLSLLTIDQLYPQIQSAHLQRISQAPPDDENLNAARAELVRKALGFD